MSHVAAEPEAHIGRSHGNGHCVALVVAAANMPPTAQWRPGEPARGASVPAGTIIATFNDEGRYANATDGSSHAAILIEQGEAGLAVIDQWLEPGARRRAAARRIIRPKGGAGPAADDADRYFVVET
jgi:hypothetical protein